MLKGKSHNIVHMTYSSVGPRPSSYSISRESRLNASIDAEERVPKRISFNMSTNAGRNLDTS
jgi:hypothetical protein